MSANTQAIKLDHNRLSCPTPSNHIHVQKGKRLYRWIHAIEVLGKKEKKRKCQLEFYLDNLVYIQIRIRKRFWLCRFSFSSSSICNNMAIKHQYCHGTRIHILQLFIISIMCYMSISNRMSMVFPTMFITMHWDPISMSII